MNAYNHTISLWMSLILNATLSHSFSKNRQTHCHREICNIESSAMENLHILRLRIPQIPRQTTKFETCSVFLFRSSVFKCRFASCLVFLYSNFVPNRRRKEKNMSTGSRWAHVGVHKNRCVKSQVVVRKSLGIEFDANDFKCCVELNNWRLFIMTVLGGGSSYASSDCNWPKADDTFVMQFWCSFSSYCPICLNCVVDIQRNTKHTRLSNPPPPPFNGVEFLFGNSSRLHDTHGQICQRFSWDGIMYYNWASTQTL